MNYEQRESGLIVPKAKSEPPVPPPEHPVRQDIREVLLDLHTQLGQYEQTTHAAMGPHTIETVAKSLVAAYNDPSAYTVSNLYQHIEGFIDSAARDLLDK